MDDQRDSTTERLVLITWSPKTTTTLKNVNKIVQRHCDLFFYKLLSFTNNFELNPELNMNGNIHYHGYIAFNNEYKKEYNLFILTLKANGMLKINRVLHSLNQAMDYCRKDRSALNGMILNKYLPISESNYKSWCKYNFLSEKWAPSKTYIELIEKLVTEDDINGELEEDPLEIKIGGSRA